MRTPSDRTVDPDRTDSAGALLRSVVGVARAIFGAAAGSVCLLDEETQELVFEAVSGEGETALVGRRIPAGRGIAGYVAMSGEPMIVDDLPTDTTFARDIAESTDFVPTSLMAAPLLCGDRILGVLEVLDPAPRPRSDLAELQLLTLFAHQAAIALQVVNDSRARGRREPAEALRAVREMTDDSRAAGLEVIEAVRELLRTSR